MRGETGTEFSMVRRERELQEQSEIRARVRRAIHGHACAREREYREKPPRIDSNPRDDRLLVREEKINPRGKTGGKDGMLAKSTESSAVIKVH